MKVSWVETAKVTPYERNPRKNLQAVAKVAASIREYGWRQPIVVDEAMVVLAGHTRLLAAKQLGERKVPVHIAEGLSAAQAKAYRLADNRVAEEAEWDTDLLRLELHDLESLGAPLAPLGFDDKELAALLASVGGLLEDADPDEVPEVPVDPISKPGDLIELGRHRLLCGSATNGDDWATLMQDAKADMVWTDPPYGVDYSSKNEMLNKADKGNRVQTPIANDDLSSEELGALLDAAFGYGHDHSRAGASWYVAAPAGPLHLQFAVALQSLGLWRQTLQWVKNGMVLGRADYHSRHEPIFYGWKEGAAHTWNGGRSQDTVLEFPKPRKSDLHPTMKPVALVQRCIENNTHPGDLVVDPFGGSGTTLIAAEACGRQARLIELSPAYCDVIVRRWEEATGGTAKRP